MEKGGETSPICLVTSIFRLWCHRVVVRIVLLQTCLEDAEPPQTHSYLFSLKAVPNETPSYLFLLLIHSNLV